MFIYPSLYEGFGLPVLEALASGVPVIAANTTSLPEVLGDAGLYCDPLDSASMTRSMQMLWRNPDLAQQLRAAGWHVHANFRGNELLVKQSPCMSISAAHRKTLIPHHH